MDGNPVSGLNSVPELTLAQYNALNVKPKFWVRTDAPESYKKLSADQVSYDSNNTVKDKIDESMYSIGTITGNTTKNILIPFQSSGVFYFLGAEQGQIGEAISHAWSSDKILKFIGTQPAKVTVTVNADSYSISNVSGNSLLIFYQRIRGDMPSMS